MPHKVFRCLTLLLRALSGSFRNNSFTLPHNFLRFLPQHEYGASLDTRSAEVRAHPAGARLRFQTGPCGIHSGLAAGVFRNTGRDASEYSGPVCSPRELGKVERTWLRLFGVPPTPSQDIKFLCAFNESLGLWMIHSQQSLLGDLMRTQEHVRNKVKRAGRGNGCCSSEQWS